MRVVLVNQPLSPHERYGELAAAGSYSPPMGLLSLAAVARRAGHDVSILDAQAQGWGHEETLRMVEAARPDAVGLTAFTSTFPSGKKLAAMIAERLRPRPAIVLGGPHVTALPAESLAECPAADVAVIGEGETTFVELLESLGRGAGAGLSGIAGVMVRGGAAAEGRGFITDLDSLPLPAWDLLPGFPARYGMQHTSIGKAPSTSIITTRGCVKSCIFCDRSVFGRRVRGNSAPYMVSMIERLHRDFGIRSLNFEDDSFLVLKKRLVEFCELLIAKGPRVTWACQTPADTVQEDLLPLMRRAGCRMINYGVESGSQAILDLMEKRTSLPQMEAAIRMTREAGIHARGLMIAGFFGETRGTMAETLAFLRKSALDDISWHYFTPFPGSAAWGLVAKYGTFTPDWDLMNLYHPVFIPRGLAAEDLTAFIRKSYRRFYLKPSVILSYLGRVRSPRQFLSLARSGAVLLSYAFRRRRA